MRPIDADAIKEDIDKSIFDADDKEWYLTLLANAPTIEPKQGEWIEEIYLNGHTYGTCSNCLHVRIQDNYCPNCGAKMNKGTDND